MVEGRVVVAGIMLLIFAVMVGFAFTFPGEARFLPLVIGVPGLALSLAQFVIELRGKEADEKAYTAADRMAELKMFGWFAVFIFGIILFGFPYAGPIIVALYLHFSWGEKWYTSLGAAAFSWAILHGIFDYVLGLPLFEGLVYQWIYG
jgi:Tripartite tricarboxylate transporter TctB family